MNNEIVLGDSSLCLRTAPTIRPTSHTMLAAASARTFVRNASADTVAGTLSSGMYKMDVVPPAAAEREQLAHPSHSAFPGSLQCTCGSTSLDMTTVVAG